LRLIKIPEENHELTFFPAVIKYIYNSCGPSFNDPIIQVEDETNLSPIVEETTSKVEQFALEK